MSEPVRKPDLREQLGVAFSASSLMMRENAETALERVAALGAATRDVQTTAARNAQPPAPTLPIRAGARDLRHLVATMTPKDERDVLAGELSAALWHLRYGEQIELVPKVAALFGAWLSQRKRFEGQPVELMTRFATRSLDEWLSSRCQKCMGSKKEEKSPSGQWVKPRGAMARNAVFRQCAVCNGSGRAFASHPLRMKLLGLDREQYDQGRWSSHFNAASAWLSKLLSPLVYRPLTRHLERRKRRP